MPVYLIGPRAAGKTTLGYALAQSLGWTFSDTDAHVQQEYGQSIAQMVAEEGWTGFRARESEALRQVTFSLPSGRQVIATGGGIVLSAENRAFMRRHGTVFFLAAPVPVLVERLKNDSHKRPSLTGVRSSEEEVLQVLAQRLPLYEETAHHVIDAGQAVQRMCEEVLRRMQRAADARS